MQKPPKSAGCQCPEYSAFIGPEASVIGIVCCVSFDLEPTLTSAPVIPPLNLFSSFVFTKENVIAPFAKIRISFWTFGILPPVGEFGYRAFAAVRTDQLKTHDLSVDGKAAVGIDFPVARIKTHVQGQSRIDCFHLDRIPVMVTALLASVNQFGHAMACYRSIFELVPAGANGHVVAFQA